MAMRKGLSYCMYFVEEKFWVQKVFIFLPYFLKLSAFHM